MLTPIPLSLSKLFYSPWHSDAHPFTAGLTHLKKKRMHHRGHEEHEGKKREIKLVPFFVSSVFFVVK